MTTISTFEDFIEEFEQLKASKDNPDEWYIVSGRQVGEYSIHTAAQPEAVPDDQTELPPEERDATENVDGFYQIGTQGWSEEAFIDDAPFVAEAGFSTTYDVIDRRINGLLLVHESVLSEDALGIAHGRGDEAEAER